MWCNKRSLIFIFALLPVYGWALDSDRTQPININADRISVDEKQGFSHYQGNVVLTQGTLKVNGDSIKVYLSNNRLQRIIVEGNPATLQQQPDPQQELVTSRAGRMEYDVDNSLLLLTTNAEVQQGPNRFSGNHIEYNMQTSTVTAQRRPEDDAEDGGDGRVSVTIDPAIQNKGDKETP